MSSHKESELSDAGRWMSPSPKLVEEGEGSPQPAFKTRVDSHILLYSGAWGCHSEGTHEYPRQLELEEQHPIARTTSPVQFASRTSIAGSQAVGLGISTPRPSVPKACASGSYLSLAEVETRRRNIARRGAPSSPSSSGGYINHVSSMRWAYGWTESADLQVHQRRSLLSPAYIFSLVQALLAFASLD